MSFGPARPCLGILGGTGACASAEFHRRFVATWPKSHLCQDDLAYPRILHLSEPLAPRQTNMVPFGHASDPESDGKLSPFVYKRVLDQVSQALEAFRAFRCQVVAVPSVELDQVIAEALQQNYFLRQSLQVLTPLSRFEPGDAANAVKQPNASFEHNAPLFSPLLNVRALCAADTVVLAPSGIALELPQCQAITPVEHLQGRVNELISKVVRGRHSRAAHDFADLLDELGRAGMSRVVLASPELSCIASAATGLKPQGQHSGQAQEPTVLDSLDTLIHASVTALLGQGFQS